MVTESSAAAAPIQTECVVIGAGPAGLFALFELGLLGMKAHIVDTLKQAGGQCSELYPDKPIYDIPAVPSCTGQELVDRLMKQVEPFGAGFHFGEEVTTLVKHESGRFTVATSAGTSFDAGAVVVAAGLGSFQPRRLMVEGADALEGRRVHYRVKSAQDFHGQDVMILGGGDSALDWVIEFCGKAKSVTLVHRRTEFRAAPASVARMQELAAAGQVRLLAGTVGALHVADGVLTGASVNCLDGTVAEVTCNQVLAFFGLHPKLGPVADWGIALEKKALKVDTEKFQTSVPGIFAIGDINTYPGKKKLILSGFHEAALAAFGVQQYLYPTKKQFLQYTTTSPVMQQRLGVTATPDDEG
ncbi:MAG: NAD(P)/FAD-dependent oxidoreductase [Gammaproteobacteria bacterium]|nr:NAD(P)/FAD-dependent oxidoreductase [Gammaproteobacteria bacterium]